MESNYTKRLFASWNMTFPLTHKITEIGPRRSRVRGDVSWPCPAAGESWWSGGERRTGCRVRPAHITPQNHIFTLRHIYCDAYDAIIDFRWLPTTDLLYCFTVCSTYWLCVPPNQGCGAGAGAGAGAAGAGLFWSRSRSRGNSLLGGGAGAGAV